MQDVNQCSGQVAQGYCSEMPNGLNTCGVRLTVVLSVALLQLCTCVLSTTPGVDPLCTSDLGHPQLLPHTVPVSRSFLTGYMPLVRTA